MTRRLQLLRRRSCRAFTLLELSVALAVFGVVMLCIASLAMFTARSFESLGNYSDMDRESRFTLDMLSHDVRQALGVFSYATNQLVLTNAGSTLTYAWDTTNAVVTRTYQDTSTTLSRNLLRQCDYLSFRMFQRNPANNFTFLATDNPAQAKLIELTWRCSRRVYGRPLNTETLQTAKFVIRN